MTLCVQGLIGREKEEDLYRWMQEQQDATKVASRQPLLQFQQSGGGKESLISVSELSQDESTAWQQADRLQVMSAFQLVKAEVSTRSRLYREQQ